MSVWWGININTINTKQYPTINTKQYFLKQNNNQTDLHDKPLEAKVHVKNI